MRISKELNVKTSERLDLVIAERHLLKHPFYQAWTAGQLTPEVLRDYAAQYFAQVDAFPRFVSSVHSRCPEIEARKVLLENLADEEIHGVDHPELWLRFAEGMGVTREQVRSAKRLPTTDRLVETFYGLTSGDWTEGLCALYAYESQVPAVAASKVEGLARFYGVTEARAIQFFKAHMHYDVEHAGAVGELVNRYADPARAEKAAFEAADAQWKFLDGFPLPDMAVKN
jgi:pyrroloquinoline-quinone synthase